MALKFAVIGVAMLALGGGAAFADELRDYGEHLAGECTTCHRLDGVDSGIPSIVGMDAESFVVVMKAYQTGDLTNQAMVSVAQSLDDEQLKALAAFFSSLESKEDKEDRLAEEKLAKAKGKASAAASTATKPATAVKKAATPK